MICLVLGIYLVSVICSFIIFRKVNEYGNEMPLDKIYMWSLTPFMNSLFVLCSGVVFIWSKLVELKFVGRWVDKFNNWLLGN